MPAKPPADDPFHQKRRVANEKGPDRQNWMTSSEFAKYLGVNARTFRRWQQHHKIPEPAARTASGYGIWSPGQQRKVLQERVSA